MALRDIVFLWKGEQRKVNRNVLQGRTAPVGKGRNV